MTVTRRESVGVLAERWALLPLRLVVGFGFAAHGWAKLSRGPESFAAILLAMGIPGPGVLAWVTSLLELPGGIGLMVGACVALLSLPLAVVMVTAMLGVHLRHGFSSVRLQAFTASGAVFGPVGYELNLLYVAALLALALSRRGPQAFAQSLANTINGIRILQNTGASHRHVKTVVEMALAAIKA